MVGDPHGSLNPSTWYMLRFYTILYSTVLDSFVMFLGGFVSRLFIKEFFAVTRIIERLQVNEKSTETQTISGCTTPKFQKSISFPLKQSDQ